MYIKSNLLIILYTVITIVIINSPCVYILQKKLIFNKNNK